MADLTARHDPDTGYTHLTSADAYPIPDEWFRALRQAPYRADYAHEHKGELRLRLGTERQVIADLEADGHRVLKLVGHRTTTRTRSGGARECVTCRIPYPASYILTEGRLCANPEGDHPPHPLRLVPLP